MGMNMKKVLYVVIAFFVIATSVNAQVGVYPQLLFMDPSKRSESIVVTNNGDDDKEVVIEVKYGYHSYDSLGLNYMNYNDSVTEAQYSIAPYVKVFPKKMVLKAKEQQTVKLILSDINSLPDKLYYTRFSVISKEVNKQIDSTFKPNTIRAKFNVQFGIVGVILFKKGKPECKIGIENAEIMNDSNGMRLNVNYIRSGNAPFFGTTIIKAYDSKGEMIEEIPAFSPVYFSCKKGFKLNEKKYIPGEKYSFQIIMTNEHKEIPDDYKIEFEPYVHTVTAIAKSKL